MSVDMIIRFEDARLQRAAIKLTHVGEQTVPVNTIVMQVYSWLPSLEKFRSWRTEGISYGNDGLPIMLNFSIVPGEFRKSLGEAQRVFAAAATGERPSLSFAAIVDTPEGVQGAELLFSYEGGVALHQALAGAIDRDNKIGQMVLQRQRESAYAGT